MFAINAAGRRSGTVAQATTVSGMVNGGSSARSITIVLVSPPSPIDGQNVTPNRSATATNQIARVQAAGLLDATEAVPG